MFATFKSCARSVSVAGTGLALVGIAALPLQALAHDGHAEAAKPARAQAPVDANAQVVVRDAATGQLRAATPEEAQALHASRAGVATLRKSAVAATPQARFHPSGARGARLTDEFMSYSVVVRQPDGSLATLCFESREEADAALKAAASPVAKTSTLPTE
jgi:hypothetical protein